MVMNGPGNDSSDVVLDPRAIGEQLESVLSHLRVQRPHQVADPPVHDPGVYIGQSHEQIHARSVRMIVRINVAITTARIKAGTFGKYFSTIQSSRAIHAMVSKIATMFSSIGYPF